MRNAWTMLCVTYAAWGKDFKQEEQMGAAAGCGSPLQGECLEGFDTLGLHQYDESGQPVLLIS
jgi:hypothetical protein